MQQEIIPLDLAGRSLVSTLNSGLSGKERKIKGGSRRPSSSTQKQKEYFKVLLKAVPNMFHPNGHEDLKQYISESTMQKECLAGASPLCWPKSVTNMV